MLGSEQALLSHIELREGTLLSRIELQEGPNMACQRDLSACEAQ